MMVISIKPYNAFLILREKKCLKRWTREFIVDTEIEWEIERSNDILRRRERQSKKERERERKREREREREREKHFIQQ